MKVLKNMFLVIGLLVVIGAGVTAGIVMGIYLPALVTAARDNSVGQATLTDPTLWVLIATAAGIVGGLLVGLGIGLPRRTATALRHETIEGLQRQTTADAALAVAEQKTVAAPVVEHNTVAAPVVGHNTAAAPVVEPNTAVEGRTTEPRV